MQVRTFKANDMSEALRMIKAELGADAMILSSKQQRRGGWFGFFSKPVYEVTAALDPKPAPLPNPYREREERVLNTREEFQNSMLAPLARELRDLRERVEKLASREEQAAPPQEFQAGPVVEQPPVPAVAEKPKDVVRSFAPEDMDEIKKFLLDALVKKDQKVVPLLFPQEQQAALEKAQPVEEQKVGDLVLAEIREELRAAGMEDEAVDTLLDYIRPGAEQGEEKDELRYSLIEAFAGLVKCTGPVKMKKAGPRIIALVGPTGVGKTTTTAKLAAMYAMNKGASVALVTTDNFRVGAIEQLRTYSKIMGVPLEVASTQKEMAKVLESHAEKDLIIIDTAGRSPKDQERLEELKGILEMNSDIETHLCLSATTKDKELHEAIRRFGVLPISRLLFTKIDESESLGCIINLQMRSKLPLSYLTNGQMVPEDIVVASPRKLANLVMRETGK